MFCVQLTKVYEAETFCNLVVIISAIDLLKIELSSVQCTQLTFVGTVIHTLFHAPTGTDNSVSSLKMVELWLDGGGGQPTVSKNISRLPYELNDLMPDYEYLVRCGWTPNGRR